MELDSAWVREMPVPAPAGPLVPASYVQANSKRSVPVPLASLSLDCCLLTADMSVRSQNIVDFIHLCSALQQEEHLK